MELRGYLEHVDRGLIRGWAWDADDPQTPVALLISDNGVPVGRVVADAYRADLECASIGQGLHGFEFVVPDRLSPFRHHMIEVRCETKGQEITHSPWIGEFTPDPGEMPPPRRWCGQIDAATRMRVVGWVQDADDPETPVALQIFDNGALVARVLANAPRVDLQQAGVGSGRHSFDVLIPGGLSPFTRHVIEVRREVDGAEIENSPAIIEIADCFDEALEQVVGKAVEALHTGDQRQHALAFMLTQADRLLNQQAQAEGQHAERLAYRQFRRRWGPPAEQMEGVVDPGLRALVIDTYLPITSRDAGSQAILSHMRAMRDIGYSVSFVAADEWQRTDAAAVLEAAGVTCYGAPFYASVEDLLRRQAGCFDVVYLHRASIATRYLALARHYMPQSRIVYAVADLHHVRMERQAAVEERPELLMASRRMRLAEFTAAWAADAVIAHSSVEAGILRRSVPEAKVYQVGWEVPDRPAMVPFEHRYGLAFIGHYGHAPNMDAALWLTEEIMPLVWRTDPAITCMLAGSAMSESIRRLAGPNIEILGQVGDLGATVFDRVRLTVAPLRYGAGVKGKVLESFAAGIPCVMSEIAAEGIALSPALCSAVGQDAAAMAALVCRLHSDEVANVAVAHAGRSLIEQNFTAGATAAALRVVLKAPVLVSQKPVSF